MSSSLFDFIKASVLIQDVVQEYVSLKPAGSYLKGFSPFKSEKTPSFTVSPHKGIYYCFSTGNGGDVIDFVAKVEHCSQIEAAHLLVERYQLTVPENLKQAPALINTDARKMHEKTCAIFARWCHDQLRQNQAAQAYCAQRNLSQKSIDQFYLGYCPAGNSAVDSLITYARSENVLVHQLLEANLLAEGGSSGLFLTFDDRIIFPINDLMGRICGFGGRVFKANDTRAKYYNSKDHDFFNKKNLLFGFHHAKKSIQSLEKAYLVEGYLDCIAMAQAGYTNTVATLGTACTQEHLTHLGRLAHHITVMYDGDEAGQKAILRLTQLCWQSHLDLSVITLPQGDDPASLLGQGKRIEDAGKPQSLFSFCIKHLGEGFSRKSLSEKMESINQLTTMINGVPDALQQEMLLHEVAQVSDIPISLLKGEQAKIRRRQGAGIPHRARTTQEKSAASEGAPVEIPLLEKKLFSGILHGKVVLDSDDDMFLKSNLPAPLLRLCELWERKGRQFDTFFSDLDATDQAFVSALWILIDESTPARECQSLLVHFQRKYWRLRVQELKMRIAKAQEGQGKGSAEVGEALAEFQKIKAMMVRKGVA